MPRLRGLKLCPRSGAKLTGGPQHYHAPIEGIETLCSGNLCRRRVPQHYHAPIEGIETGTRREQHHVRGITPSITMPRLRGLKRSIVIIRCCMLFSSQHYHAPIEGIETKDSLFLRTFLRRTQHYHAPIEGIETF